MHMQKLSMGIILASGLIAAAPGRAATNTVEKYPLPEITIPICATPPAINGQFDDPCWKTAAVIDKLYVLAKPGTVTSDHRIQATWDNQWLYLAFTVAHPSPKLIKPAVLQHDGSINSDDSVEIFLDPGSAGALYYQYKLNAANVRAEQQKIREHDTYRTKADWDLPWRSATRITDKGWQAEIAIPLFALAAQGHLDQLRLNLTINTIIPVIDPQGVQVYCDKAWFTWAPLFQSFHEPFRFGYLKGLEQAKPEVPCLAGLRYAAAGNYYARDGRYYYDITAELQGFTPTGGKLEIKAVDQPISGKGETVVQPVVLTGLQTQTLKWAMPTTTLASRTARLVMTDPGTGEILETVHLTDTRHLSLMTGVFPDRSYYTTEEQATIGCAISLPAEALQGASLAVRDSGGKTLGQTSTLGSIPQVGLSIKNLDAGTHLLKLELIGADGSPMISQSFELIKKAPKPGREWKIDRNNLVVLHDGQPFFPFGVVLAGTNEALYQEVAAAGCNAILVWNAARDPTNAAAAHGLAARYNLMVVEPLDRYATQNLIHAKSDPNFAAMVDGNLDRMLTAVNNLKDCPTLLGYYQFDEPGSQQIEPGRKLYRKVNAIDGYHPWGCLYSSYIPEGDEYLDWSDIICTDPYWIPNGNPAREGVRGTINFVSKIVTWTKRRGDGIHHPTWIVPVGELWSGMRQRVILPQEQFCQTYLALIHGAKGIFYFCYPYAHQLSIDTLGRIGKEMQVLGPIAVTPDVPQTINYQPGVFDPDKDLYPDIQVSLRRAPAGEYVLLAANSRPCSVDATYRLTGLGEAGVITCLFRTNSYPVTNGSFSDCLTAYATRAYVVGDEKSKIQNPKSKTIEIFVESKAYPEQDDPRYTGKAQPDTGRSGMKNLVRNPSFEQASVPGWPDYYTFNDFNGVGRLGTSTARFIQDTTTAWQGKASMKITSRSGNWQNWLSWWPGIVCTLAPQVEKSTHFVFSAYLKADRDGLKARLWPGFDFGGSRPLTEMKDNPEFTLTTGWKRYSISGVLPPALSPYHGFGVRVYGEGTVWVDALQLEKGSEPTDFEP